MASFEQFARELKAFDGRKEIIKQVRKDIRKPVPGVRKAIKDSALSKLPKRGGLNKWVAKSKLSARITVKGPAVAIKLKAGRNSAGGRSDIRSVDRGRVRHPSWGRRGKGQWHTQTVTPEFFTDPVTQSVEQFSQAVESAVDAATKSIRG